jgi:hypothetical protein
MLPFFRQKFLSFPRQRQMHGAGWTYSDEECPFVPMFSWNCGVSRAQPPLRTNLRSDKRHFWRPSKVADVSEVAGP